MGLFRHVLSYREDVDHVCGEGLDHDVPALQWVFRMEPITAVEWLRVLLIFVTVVVVVEIDKLVRRIVASR